MRKNVRKSLKNSCEIEGCQVDNKALLHLHHIVERTEIGTSNHEMNLCCLCANHHNLTHSGELKIIGVFPSTKPPLGRTLVYELNGKINVSGIYEEYFKHKMPKVKV